MIVSGSARLQILSEADRELSGDRSPQSEEYYHRKLAATWERARSTEAYAGIAECYSRSALNRLPVTTKDDLKRDPWAYVAGGDLGLAVKYYETTGTTGTVTPTPRRPEDVIWNATSVAHAWKQLLGPNDRVLNLLPSDVVPVADLVADVCDLLEIVHTRAYPFSTGITGWDRVISLWERLRPTVLFAAPGVVLQLTSLLQRRTALATLAGTVREIMLLGEVSTPALRNRLAASWDARVHDASYGSTETGTLATACPAGAMHLLVDANYVELATASGVRPAEAGATGRLVVTPLNLHARPLLRLDTGDVVKMLPPCPCGWAAPAVEVQGRSSDTVRLHGKELTIREVETVVYGAAGAMGYLLELDRDGTYGRMLLERDVEADRSAEADSLTAVQRSSLQRLGTTWDDVVYVNSLPQTTKSGGSQKSWKRSNVRTLERTP